MKIVLLLTCLALASCNSTKSTADAEKETTEMNDKTDMQTAKSAAEMQAEGYLKGIIVAGNKKEGSCEYVLEIKGGFAEQKVDPTNLDKAFKSDSQKVWVKFRALRMMNRCPEARPVEIVEIFERAE